MSMVDCHLPVPITTPRLVIRDAIRADMRGWSALYRSPKVRQHMNGPLKRKPQEWWGRLQQHSADLDRPLSIALPETNELVGACGFLNGAQLGERETWLLLRAKFWGKAIGTEVTSSLVGVAFASLDAQRVIGIVDPANHASVNMIKKIGFAFVREYSGKVPWQLGHHIYSIERHTHSRATQSELT